MAIKIIDDCIVCNACLPECPNNAIYVPSEEWTLKDGTSIVGEFQLMNGLIISSTEKQAPIAPFGNDYYYIVPDKCTECQGFHDEPQCAVACPVDACVPDEMYKETVDELMAKKRNCICKKIMGNACICQISFLHLCRTNSGDKTPISRQVIFPAERRRTGFFAIFYFLLRPAFVP